MCLLCKSLGHAYKNSHPISSHLQLLEEGITAAILTGWLPLSFMFILYITILFDTAFMMQTSSSEANAVGDTPIRPTVILDPFNSWWRENTKSKKSYYQALGMHFQKSSTRRTSFVNLSGPHTVLLPCTYVYLKCKKTRHFLHTSELRENFKLLDLRCSNSISNQCEKKGFKTLDSSSQRRHSKTSLAF